MHFAPCTGCGRHVRADDEACPFCGAAFAGAPPRPSPTARLGRAALFAFGAAVASAGLGACGESHGPTDDAGPTPTDAGVDAGFDAGAIAPPYGIPPDDGGGGVPLYGGAPED
ncbi:MAG: hypothetical protein KF729_29260 [Sandaracinaceae bacterium]|nr:hypothetical protein [Sandaracinaceae bacterium]